MEAFIQYKRFLREIVNPNQNEMGETPTEQIESFFKELVTGGWTIIYYDENITAVDKLAITVVAGKKQPNII